MPSCPRRRRPEVLLISRLFLACTLLAAVVPPIRGATSTAADRHGEPGDPAESLVLQVQQEVGEIRGLEFRRPVPARTVDDDTARAHMLRRLDRFDFDERFQQTARVYGMLGLLDPDQDVMEIVLAALREQVGGFYDPEAKALYLLDDMPEVLGPTLAAHELTHALEDQHFDLDARLLQVIDDDDRLFARSAVHEGSATIVMSLFSARAAMRGQLDPVRLQQASSELAQGRRVAELPPVLLRGLLGPYVLGAQFLARGNPAALAQGFPFEDVQRAYEAGPTSSEQILHPEKFWDAGQFDPPTPVTFGAAGRKLGRGWSRRGQGVLGELLIGLLVKAQTPTEPTALMLGGAAGWTHPAAAGWDGDRWQLWTRGDSQALLLSTVWDTPEDALEFAAALPRGRGFTWRTAGSAVAIVAGEVGKRTDAVLRSLLKSAQKSARESAKTSVRDR